MVNYVQPPTVERLARDESHWRCEATHWGPVPSGHWRKTRVAVRCGKPAKWSCRFTYNARSRTGNWKTRESWRHLCDQHAHDWCVRHKIEPPMKGGTMPARRTKPKPKTKPGPKPKLKAKVTRTSYLSRVIDMRGLPRNELGKAVGRDGSWLAKVQAGKVTVAVSDAVAIVAALNKAAGYAVRPPNHLTFKVRYCVDHFWTKTGLVKA